MDNGHNNHSKFIDLYLKYRYFIYNIVLYRYFDKIPYRHFQKFARNYYEMNHYFTNRYFYYYLFFKGGWGGKNPSSIPQFGLYFSCK